MASRSSRRKQRVEAAFNGYLKRREGILQALTTDLLMLGLQCDDPREDKMALYGTDKGDWYCTFHLDMPTDIPRPTPGINFAKGALDRKDWLSLVAAQSDAWLISVAFFTGAEHFDHNDRQCLFHMINDIPTLSEAINEINEKQRINALTESKTDSNMESESSYEEEDEEPEPFCRKCEETLTLEEEFLFCCDHCQSWFHGECLKLTPATGENIMLYKCGPCARINF